MITFPALDLIEIAVVRLFQGDYGQVTEYKVGLAEQFNPAASWCWLAAPCWF